MDTTGPTVRRGKETEGVKSKKLSKMKKVQILFIIGFSKPLISV